ncbi:MAG: hypothetical protein WCF56_10255, partial [Pseudolabrys sp.]
QEGGWAVGRNAQIHIRWGIAVSAFANCGRAVAFVRSTYVPIPDQIGTCAELDDADFRAIPPRQYLGVDFTRGS